MKRLTAILLALCVLLGCVSCTTAAPEPTAEPTPEPVPEGGIELWYWRAQQRYNMEYEGFAEYLSLMCDEFYGDSVKTILRILPMPDKDAEIEAKRSEYSEKYGEDWEYVISEKTETELGEKACSDFAEELEDICGRIEVLTDAAADWSDTQWTDFAAALGCGAEDAKQLVAAYAAMKESCKDANVTKAIETTLTLSFSGSKTEELFTTEKNTVYEVNGHYVSEMLPDLSYSIINLIY